jgi:hypothetical protein
MERRAEKGIRHACTELYLNLSWYAHGDLTAHLHSFWRNKLPCVLTIPGKAAVGMIEPGLCGTTAFPSIG